MLEEEKSRNEKEIQQLKNRQKILLNRERLEERRARTHRLIEHGAILEAVFPAVTSMEGEAVKAFLTALFRLPEVWKPEKNKLSEGEAR